MRKTITINVAGRDFNIVCEDSKQSELIATAKFVDNKIDEIKQGGKTVGSDKIAIMAALNIATELSALQKKLVNLREDDDQVVDDILSSLDSAIVGFK